MHMFSLFPELFFLTPLAVTLLRIVTGSFFVYAAIHFVIFRSDLTRDRFPFIGMGRTWMAWLGACACSATGVLLIIGLWTQAAAIIGALIALTVWITAKSN